MQLVFILAQLVITFSVIFIDSFSQSKIVHIITPPFSCQERL
ncbi:hypothetical protein HMPREF1405_01651 [Helicobacter pylori GAM231Ai]|nr:hypothetical protein HMPREF1405_01651 [Helicobacter pylori GAM231Ai]